MSTRRPLPIALPCLARSAIALVLVIGSVACGPTDPNLKTLTVSHGVSMASLDPAFAPDQTKYAAALFPLCLQTAIITATAADPKGVGIRIRDKDGVADGNVVSGVSSKPIQLTPGVNQVNVEVTVGSKVERTYTVDVPVGESTYVKAFNTDANDYFGVSVAVSSDTLVIGAPGESSNATRVNQGEVDNSAPSSGAVYVFRRSGTTWVREAYIKASNTDAGDRFGSSVALSGETLAVGAEGESSNSRGVNSIQADNSAQNSGAVYIFVRSSNTWSQKAYIKASNTDADDRFGSRVALDNGTLAVGARWESSSATGVGGQEFNNDYQRSGAVYVFVSGPTGWTQQAYIKAFNTGPGDQFGDSVALSGDTLAVGAPQEDSAATGIDGDETSEGASGSGAVYIFIRSGTTWSKQAYLKASNTGEFDLFGTSVALSGERLAVGARGESSNSISSPNDDSAPSSGAVYTFTRADGNAWSGPMYIKASNPNEGDRFGISVALDGDRLLVGASGEDSIATGEGGSQTDNQARDSGAAYLFVRLPESRWRQGGYLKASNTNPSDGFGGSVALLGEILAVSASQEASGAMGIGGSQTDNSAANSGAVYACP